MRLGGEPFVGSSLMQVLCQMCNLAHPDQSSPDLPGSYRNYISKQAGRSQGMWKSQSLARPHPSLGAPLSLMCC